MSSSEFPRARPTHSLVTSSPEGSGFRFPYSTLFAIHSEPSPPLLRQHLASLTLYIPSRTPADNRPRENANLSLRGIAVASPPAQPTPPPLPELFGIKF